MLRNFLDPVLKRHSDLFRVPDRGSRQTRPRAAFSWAFIARRLIRYGDARHGGCLLHNPRYDSRSCIQCEGLDHARRRCPQGRPGSYREPLPNSLRVLPGVPVVVQRQRIPSRSVEHAIAAPAQAIAYDPSLLVRSTGAAGEQAGGAAGAPADRGAGSRAAGDRADDGADGGTARGTQQCSAAGASGDVDLVGVLLALGEIALVSLLIDALHVDDWTGRARGGAEREDNDDEDTHFLKTFLKSLLSLGRPTLGGEPRFSLAERSRWRRSELAAGGHDITGARSADRTGGSGVVGRCANRLIDLSDEHSIGAPGQERNKIEPGILATSS